MQTLSFNTKVDYHLPIKIPCFVKYRETNVTFLREKSGDLGRRFGSCLESKGKKIPLKCGNLWILGIPHHGIHVSWSFPKKKWIRRKSNTKLNRINHLVLKLKLNLYWGILKTSIWKYTSAQLTELTEVSK